MKALLFAAGMGTRLKSYTQDKPKALVTLAGKPLIQHAIEYLISFGITDITINVFHFAEQVIAVTSLQGVSDNSIFYLQISVPVPLIPWLHPD